VTQKGRYDTQHNDIQHNDTQHNDTENNGRVSSFMSSVMCHVSCMLSATNKTFMLSVVILNVVLLNIIMLSAIILSVLF
jgi:hypothetical protein